MFTMHHLYILFIVNKKIQGRKGNIQIKKFTLAKMAQEASPSPWPKKAPQIAPHLFVFFQHKHIAIGPTADPINTPIIS